jgi:hypothetical protein
MFCLKNSWHKDIETNAILMIVFHNLRKTLIMKEKVYF